MDDERRPDEEPRADDSTDPQAPAPVDQVPAGEAAAADAPDAPGEATVGTTSPDDQQTTDDAIVPPPLVDWDAPAAPASGWAATAAAVAGTSSSRIDIGSLFGRTLDTFLAGWRTFVVLGIPAAVLAWGVQLVAYDFVETPAMVGLSLILALFAIVVYLAVLLAMIVAADDIRAGRPTSVGSALRRGLSRTGVAILSSILFVLTYFGLALVLVLGLAILVAFPGGSLGGILALVLGIVGFALIIYVLLRLSLFVAPIALANAGPMDGLRIARVVKGHLWRLGVLFVAVYLLIFPLALGAAFLILATTPVIGVVVGIVAFTVTGPLLPIVLSLSYGDLTGRPRAEPHVRSPRRGLFAVAVLVGGIVLLVPSIALAVPRLGELALAAIPPEDRGQLYFGTARNPVNPCAPLERATSFTSSDSIYIGGYFSRSLLPGQSASIHVYVDDNEVVNSPIQAGAQAVACYYEPVPLVGAPAGEYRIVIDDSAGLFAEGTFTVQ